MPPIAATNDDVPVAFTIQNLTAVPTPTDYHKTTCLVNCVMERHTPSGCLGFASSKFRFAVQSASGEVTTYLMAATESSRGYAITSATDQPTKLGSLARIQSGMSCVTYALYDQEGVQIATILYTVASVAQALSEARPSRRAQIALTSKALDNEADPTWFEKACKSSIRKNGNLNDIDVPLYVSKIPYIKKGGRVGLNFRGRGAVASPKNMQVVRSDEGGNQVLLQMAKWETNTYNVDFAAPFTFLHAFAFGLAQMDL